MQNLADAYNLTLVEALESAALGTVLQYHTVPGLYPVSQSSDLLITCFEGDIELKHIMRSYGRFEELVHFPLEPPMYFFSLQDHRVCRLPSSAMGWCYQRRKAAI